MALKPLQAQNPLGTFDGLDSQVTSFLGGEVVTLVGVNLTALDQGAADLSDGYVGTTAANHKRPAVTKTLSSGTRPLFLCDEGILGYGTLFGRVVGGTVGQVLSGTQLGPHTATGSGKVTCWGNPGLYAVTLDAVDTTAATGLAPTNSTLAVGAALYATTAGLLTPNVASAFEAVVVARFVEFTTDGSLVTSTRGQVQALNSPTGSPAVLLGFTQAVIHFQGV